MENPPPTTPAAEGPDELKRRNLRNFFASIRYSVDGFMAALKHEPSFREDFLFVILLVPFAVILPINAVSTAVMLASLLVIMIVELLNSAIEWTIDYLRPEHHPLAAHQRHGQRGGLRRLYQLHRGLGSHAVAFQWGLETNRRVARLSASNIQWD